MASNSSHDMAFDNDHEMVTTSIEFQESLTSSNPMVMSGDDQDIASTNNDEMISEDTPGITARNNEGIMVSGENQVLEITSTNSNEIVSGDHQGITSMSTHGPVSDSNQEMTTAAGSDHEAALTSDQETGTNGNQGTIFGSTQEMTPDSDHEVVLTSDQETGPNDNQGTIFSSTHEMTPGSDHETVSTSNQEMVITTNDNHGSLPVPVSSYSHEITSTCNLGMASGNSQGIMAPSDDHKMTSMIMSSQGTGSSNDHEAVSSSDHDIISTSNQETIPRDNHEINVPVSSHGLGSGIDKGKAPISDPEMPSTSNLEMASSSNLGIVSSSKQEMAMASVSNQEMGSRDNYGTISTSNTGMIVSTCNQGIGSSEKEGMAFSSNPEIIPASDQGTSTLSDNQEMFSCSDHDYDTASTGNDYTAWGGEQELASSSDDEMDSSVDLRTLMLAKAIQKRQRQRRRAWQSACCTHLDFPPNVFYEGKREEYIDFHADPYKVEELFEKLHLPPFTKQMLNLVEKLFRSLVEESFKKNFVAWAAKGNTKFRACVEDLLVNSAWIDANAPSLYAGLWAGKEMEDLENLMGETQAGTQGRCRGCQREQEHELREMLIGDSEPEDDMAYRSETETCEPSNSEVVVGSQTEDKKFDLFRLIAEGMLDASHKNDTEFLDHVMTFCHDQHRHGRDSDHEATSHLWQHLRSVRDKRGYSPLHIAVIMGYQEVAERLVFGTYRGREFFNVDYGKEGQDERVFLNFDVLHARTREGWTPLHLATVATGYDDLSYSSGEVYAINSKVQNKAPTLLDILIAMYDKVLTPTRDAWDFLDNGWMTPLHYAVLTNRQGVVKKLLEWNLYQRHVNVGDCHRKTPLHMAICHSNSFHFQKLSQLSDPFFDPWDKQRSLFESYAQPSIDLIKALAECPCVDVHAVDCCSYTPLHWAIHIGNTEVVKYLVSLKDSKRARATLKDKEGRTVMQMATEGIETLDTSKQFDREIWGSVEVDHGDSDQEEGHSANRGVFEDIQTVLLGCNDVKQDIERLYRDRQVYVDATNAILVGSALIASLTFQGWLQPPEFDQSRGTHRWVRVFWWCNSISFYFSVASVTAGAAASLPMGHKVYIGRAVQKLRYWLSLTSLLLMISAFHVVIAFAGSGFAAVSVSVPHLEKNMIVSTSVGMPVCSIIIFSALFRLRGLLLDLMRFPARGLKLPRLFIVDPMINWWRLQDSRLPLIPQKLTIGHSTSIWRKDLHRVLSRVKSFTWTLSKDEMKSKAEKRLFHQLDVLTCVYQEGRRQMNVRSRQSKKDMSSSCCFGLMTRGIHHWIPRCPITTCREYSSEMDLRQWVTLAGRVDILHNQYPFLSGIKDFKKEEWFAMCIAFRRIETSIGLDRTGLSSLESDWYRFCHRSLIGAHTMTGQEMQDAVCMTVDIDVSSMFGTDRSEYVSSVLGTWQGLVWDLKCRWWNWEMSKVFESLRGLERRLARWKMLTLLISRRVSRIMDRLQGLEERLHRLETRRAELENLHQDLHWGTKWRDCWVRLEEHWGLETWVWSQEQLGGNERFEERLEKCDLLKVEMEKGLEDLDENLTALEAAVGTEGSEEQNPEQKWKRLYEQLEKGKRIEELDPKRGDGEFARLQGLQNSFQQLETTSGNFEGVLETIIQEMEKTLGRGQPKKEFQAGVGSSLRGIRRELKKFQKLLPC